jgi:hypothetical protein
MIAFYIIFIAFHFFMSGMLASAILTNSAEHRLNPARLYVVAVLCFLFGLYFSIALVGYSSR